MNENTNKNLYSTATVIPQPFPTCLKIFLMHYSALTDKVGRFVKC